VCEPDTPPTPGRPPAVAHHASPTAQYRAHGAPHTAPRPARPSSRRIVL